MSSNISRKNNEIKRILMQNPSGFEVCKRTIYAIHFGYKFQLSNLCSFMTLLAIQTYDITLAAFQIKFICEGLVRTSLIN